MIGDGVNILAWNEHRFLSNCALCEGSNRTLIGDGANVSESDFCTIHHDASHVIVTRQNLLMKSIQSLNFMSCTKLIVKNLFLTWPSLRSHVLVVVSQGRRRRRFFLYSLSVAVGKSKGACQLRTNASHIFQFLLRLFNPIVQGRVSRLKSSLVLFNLNYLIFLQQVMKVIPV